MGITRRDLLTATAGTAVLGSTVIPRIGLGATKTLKIGFLAPLTGEVSAWGLPGLYGCEVLVKNINAAGGVQIGEDTYTLEIASFDDEYLPDKALQGFKKIVSEEGAKFVMMLGGDPWPGVQRFANQSKMLATTLLPSDLSPDTPYLLAPCEVHPIYNVTGVEYLARNFPDAKRAVICAQNDSLGIPSVATYEAAFEAAGIEVVDVNIFDPATTDFAPLVTSLLAKKPDIFCYDTAYADFVNLIAQQLHIQGYKGLQISCTCDNYPQIVEKTSKEFMEGFIFQFPDFDDPKLNEPFINFPEPNKFFADYNAAHPGTWTAVSWEYPSIVLQWIAGAKLAGSIEPMQVLEAMKSKPSWPHIFGEADWWGQDLWGINNALVGKWPVVVIRDGKATIAEFGDIPAWWAKNKDVLIKRMRERNQMWDQRA